MPVHILHIDTSGPAAIVMLAVDGVPISERISDTERDHAGKINLLVGEVLEEVKLTLADVDAFVVCNGPGSYTGLRIGLATAKGYCYALGKKLLLHNRLHLMLEELEEQTKGMEVDRIAIIPARAGEYYWALKGNKYEVYPQHITTADLLSKLAENQSTVALIGHINSDLIHLSIINNIEHRSLNNMIWARVANEAFRRGAEAQIAYAEPEYLKSAYITSSRTDR